MRRIKRKHSRNSAQRNGMSLVNSCIARPLIHPTVAGVITLVLAVIAWYFALLLDQRSIAAGAVTVTVLWVLSLVVAILQSIWPAGVIGPTNPVYEPQFEKVDSDGNVIESYRGGIPIERGWYRRARTIMRWETPLGMFAVRHPIVEDGGAAIIPDMSGNERGVKLSAKLSRQFGVDEPTGMVRQYRAGDSPRLISWKHVASHGELMTRDTANEEKINVIIVLDPAAPGIDSETLDAQTAQVRAWLSESPHTMNLIVTDGVHTAANPSSVIWLLSSMCPINSDEINVTDNNSSLKAHDSSDTDDTIAENPWNVTSRVGTITQLSERIGTQTGIVLVTTDEKSPFAHDLRSASQGRIICITPPTLNHSIPFLVSRFDSDPAEKPARLPAVSAASELHSIATTSVPAPSAEETDASESGRTGISGQAVTPHSADPIRTLALPSRISTTVMSLCMALCAVLSLMGVSHILQTGMWMIVAGMFLLYASLIPTLIERKGKGNWLAVSILIAIIAGFLGLAAAIYNYTGVLPWDFGGAARVIRSGAWLPDGEYMNVSMPHDWRQVFSVIFLVFMEIELGFMNMYYQLPPITVDEPADIALIVISLFVGIIVCFMATKRASCATFAVLPFLSFGAAESLVGVSIPTWQIVLLVIASVVLIGAITADSIRIIPGATLATLIIVPSLILLPSAMRVCYSVELSLGRNEGLLSSSTVNPMLDLTRSLRNGVGSSAVALTYEANKPMYLRMATLGEFDGDTWSFDKDFARDGRFYGSGVILGDDDSNHMDDTQRLASDPSPFMQYWYTAYMINQSGGSTRISTKALSDQWQRANVTIHSLSTRFLPIIGTYLTTRSAGDDWLAYSDNTVYSRTSTTYEKMHYSTQGQYISPIDSTDFSEIQPLIDLHDELAPLARTEGDWSARHSARVALVTSGDAEIAGDHWILIPTIPNEEDGTIRDTSGTIIGTITRLQDTFYGAYYGNWASSDDMPIYWTMTDEFKERVGFGEDEAAAFVGMKSNIHTAPYLALLLDDPAEVYPASTSNGESYYDNSSSGSSPVGSNRRGLYSNDQSINAAFTALNGILDPHYIYAEDGGNAQSAGLVKNLFDSLDSANESARSMYLSLPDDLPENIEKLVADAQNSGLSTDGETRDDQLQTMSYLVDYFTNPDNGFTYSLDVSDNGGHNNLDAINDFLETRSGYCQHYSTALAILGRAMGVPTRVVIGLAAPLGVKEGAYAERSVTMGQLHAWTEAYITDVGWVPFDVTPGQGSQAADDRNYIAVDRNVAPPSPTSSESTVPDDSASDDSSAPPTPDASDTPDAAQTDSEAPDIPDDSRDQSQPSNPENVTDMHHEYPLSQRMTVIGAAVLIILLLIFWPLILRTWRRRRRMMTISRGENTRGAAGGAAWRAAWSEIRDTAYDAHVPWTIADTDDDIAGIIAAACATQENSDTQSAAAKEKWHDTISVVCTQAQAAQYGGKCRAPEGLTALVERVRHTLHPSLWRRLWPRSARHR